MGQALASVRLLAKKQAIQTNLLSVFFVASLPVLIQIVAFVPSLAPRARHS